LAEVLKYPPVRFTGVQARAVGRGFAAYVDRFWLPVHACAVLPDHVHLVIGRYRLDVEEIVIKLKSAATTRLLDEGIHPFQHLKPTDGPPPKCWAQGEWRVYLDPEDLDRAIKYVENNPVKEGLPRQRWPFVSPVELRGGAERGRLPRSAPPRG
jgi:REP element-mobilizing transposase RayT